MKVISHVACSKGSRVKVSPFRVPPAAVVWSLSRLRSSELSKGDPSRLEKRSSTEKRGDLGGGSRERTLRSRLEKHRGRGHTNERVLYTPVHYWEIGFHLDAWSCRCQKNLVGHWKHDKGAHKGSHVDTLSRGIWSAHVNMSIPVSIALR